MEEYVQIVVDGNSSILLRNGCCAIPGRTVPHVGVVFPVRCVQRGGVLEVA